MNWNTKINSCYFFEKVSIASFVFIFVILSFDCFFQNLPLSGYGIIFITLIVTSCSSICLCHGFRQCLEAGETETMLQRRIKRKEKEIVCGLFSREIASLTYPTSLNEQLRLFLKDIERDYVKHWYCDVSNNPSFLFDCHLVLEEILFKILGKLKHADCKFILKNILFMYLSHIQEYKRALRRAKTSDSADDPVAKMYRYQHPASEDDSTLNHYLKNVMEILARECAPHELVSSLEYSIVNHILARKMLKTLLVNIEDPTWIYIRMLYITRHEKYVQLMQGGSYNLKEITKPEPVEKQKLRVKPSLLNRSTDFGGDIFNRNFKPKAMGSSNDKHVLNLPLMHAKPETNISSVLGSLISSTAAPLLPDNASLCYQPLNKMWLSPVTELKQEITDSVVNPLLKTLNEFNDKKGNGLKERFLLTRSKVLTRSKSSDTMSVDEDLNQPLTQRDISVGEEMNENVFMGDEGGRRLVKTQSFDAGSGDLTDADGTASPVYEEPEDFATTIAKLRNVLQQRESSSTLSDKSVPSIEYQEKDPFGSKPSLEEANSIDSQMACDIPSDGRPFVNISIPATEIREHSNTSYVLYTIQYDGIYIKHSEEDETQLVLQTTIVKRRFQEFINLQTRLEEHPNLRQHLKGIKGPAKWLNLPFGTKTDEATTASRKIVLEKFLQLLCDRVEIASSPALHEFLAYGSNAVGTFNGSDTNSSILKIDKFISNKVTGVFNSIKTVLPSFDGNPNVLDAKEMKEKPFQEQNLFQGFLNFGSKPEDVTAINLSYHISEASGEALTDHVRHFLAEKSDCIEDALDVLDNSDWHSEAGECHVLNSNSGCVWLKFKEAVMDDELDKFDSGAPILNLILDILCELLAFSEGWVTKEPVLRVLKVISLRWEKLLEEQIASLDWDRISGNLLRLLRAVVFSQQISSSADLNLSAVQEELRQALLFLLPGGLAQLIGADNIESAMKLFLESLQYRRCNRDVILCTFDLILSQLLSCPHLTKEKSG